MSEKHPDENTGSDERVAFLRSTGLLDTPPEASFDRLTQLAARVLGVPVSLVSLVTEDRQFFKSCIGLPEPWASRRETPLSHSFCQHVVASADVLVIEDAREHPLVRSNEAIRDLGVVAYAGAPLVTSAGHVLGAFCAIDTKPRSWSEDDLRLLRDLAAAAATEIELRGEVAERRRAEERLDRLRYQHRALLDGISDPAWMKDREGRYASVNQAFVTMYRADPNGLLEGISRESLLGRTDADLFAEPVARRLREEDEQVMRRGERLVMEVRIELSSGSIRWFEAERSVIRDAGGDAIGSVGIAHDVTLRKRTEELLRLRTTQLEHLFASAPEGIVLVDEDDRVVRANPEFLRMFGFGSEEGEVLGRTVDELIVPPGGAREGDTLTREIIERGIPVAVEALRRRRDGTPIAVSILATPLQTEATEPTLYGIYRDITARKRDEALREGESTVLEMIGHGVDLKVVLTELAHVIEEQIPCALVSVLRVDEGRLRTVAASGLPAEYSAAFEGIAVGEGVGSCGTAAHRREPVLTSDIATDPLWADFRDIALRHGLAACWSYPVLSGEGAVLGTFAVYTREPGAPGPGYVRLLERATHLARVAIENAQREARLRESEARFRTLVEHSLTGVYIIKDGRFSYVNPRLAEIYGYPAEELLAVGDILGWVDPEDRPRVAEMIQRRARGDLSPQRLAYRVRRKDGSTRFVEVYGAATVVNGRPASIGAVLDVTERRAGEEQLRRQALLFEAIRDGVVVANAQSRITDWNPAAERIFGFSREEVLGRSPEDVFVQPDSRAISPAEIAESVLGGEIWTGEMVTRRKDGAEVFCECTVLPLRDVAGAIAISHDITSRRYLEEQLRQAQKMEAVGRLAGGVSHDFNNMLTAIIGFSSLLKLELEPTTRQARFLEEILAAANRAAGLTRQLLAFSRRQILQPRPIDLNALVSGMEGMLRRLISENIDIVTDLDAHLGTVVADPGQIEQVVMNLAVNARDALPGGGRLAVRTRNLDLREVHGGPGLHVPPGRYVSLEVEDTGHGIEPDTLALIFDPFFTTKGVGEGTGLGLSTVYGIVQQSGGFVWAESEVGVGSTFTVLLPRESAEPDAPAGIPEPADGTGPGAGTVLLVEDDHAVRALVLSVLHASGYAVLEAPNGQAALRLAEQHSGRIDLLLTDVVMPEMNGAELAERLLKRWPSLKVLFMSGYTEESLLRDSLRGGAELIAKPLTPDQLARRIRQVLEQDRG